VVRGTGRWSETYGARNRVPQEESANRTRLGSKRKEREVGEEDEVDEDMREPPTKH
jgi:hypothetical protein